MNPDAMDYDELEAIFLGSDDPIVEQIQEAFTEEEALELACAYLELPPSRKYKQLLSMVCKFRENS